MGGSSIHLTGCPTCYTVSLFRLREYLSFSLGNKLFAVLWKNGHFLPEIFFIYKDVQSFPVYYDREFNLYYYGFNISTSTSAANKPVYQTELKIFYTVLEDGSTVDYYSGNFFDKNQKLSTCRMNFSVNGVFKFRDQLFLYHNSTVIYSTSDKLEIVSTVAYFLYRPLISF